MRIELSDPARCVALRDYFLRLGAVASLGEGASVDVEFPEDPINEGENVEAYLRSWVETNRVAAAPRVAGEPVASEAPPPAKPEGPPRLGDLLVAKGFITPEQLAYAVVEAREQGELLGRLLLRYEWVFESELARVLAEQWGLPYLNLASIGVNRQLVQLLPREVGVRAAAIPVRRMNGSTQVAFADPTDPTALRAVREYIPSLAPAVAELSDIENAWRSVAPRTDVRADRKAEPAVAEPSQTNGNGRPKIGELFVETGLVTRADLEDALREQKTSGKPLGEILVNRRLIDRLHLANALSKQWAATQRAAVSSSETARAPQNGHVPEPSREAESADDSADEIADLLQAVVELTGSVERLRAEIEERGGRVRSDGHSGFSSVTV